MDMMSDWEYVRDPSLLTNFKIDEEAKYRRAIQVFEDETNNIGMIYIKNEAYARNDTYLPTLKSLHVVIYNMDCSIFWRIFENIRNNGTYMKKPKTKFQPK